MNAERKERLRAVVYAIKDLDEFSPDSAKLHCRDAHPAYVTRVLKQLTQEGHLDRHFQESGEVFRWSRSKPIDLETWVQQHVHGEQVKESPEEDRPREQLLAHGAAALTDGQLLAILIRVGVTGDSAVQAGRRIANLYSSDRLSHLVDASLPELRTISKAIRKDSFAQIMAGIELGRRIAAQRDVQRKAPTRIRSTEDAVRYCMQTFHRLAVDGRQEEFHIVTLDTQFGPIGTHHITTGTLDASLVHPREVFRAAIRDSASAILLVHNHPSGDPTPSREDRAVTDRLTKAGDLVGIRVLDHVVVAKESGRSVLDS